MLKTLSTIILLGFVAITFGIMLWPQSAEPAADPTSAAGQETETEATTGPAYVAYYFHGAARCYSCNLMESTAREALAADIDAGILTFHSINITLPNHQHFIESFDLHMPGIALAEFHGQTVVRRSLLDQSWGYLREPLALSNYFKDSWATFRNGQDPNL
ncbi:MAG: hypothetical protein EA402_07890 [Planctomycetota bacterium]|nr:MAG: hypothetical protein EA402_07890 [Planctomycetota bacterium]